jgi:hypothetical protein
LIFLPPAEKRKKKNEKRKKGGPLSAPVRALIALKQHAPARIKAAVYINAPGL